MTVTAIKTPYGATVHKTFAVYGFDCNEDEDCALFVIRDKNDDVVYWDTLVPIFNEDLNTWTFELLITHTEAEKIPKGSYKYGLTFYQAAKYADTEPIDGDDGSFTLPKAMPVDGLVVVPIARKAYVVKEAVAREEGL